VLWSRAETVLPEAKPSVFIYAFTQAELTNITVTKMPLDLPLQNDFRVLLVVPLWLT